MTYQPSTVLITGATGDFGKAFCRRYEEIGCQIIVHGRNKAKVEELCEELDVETYPLVFDVTDKQATLEALSSIPPLFEKIDLLINNAGGALGLDKAQDALLEDWENMISMNVTGLVRVTNIILKGMANRQKGHVINIGSISGNWPYPGGHVYCATKAFVKQFTLAMRADLQGTNIRVSNIEPGMVETKFSFERFKGDKDRADAVYANTTPLTAEDIAETVFWASTLPPHVNINTLEVMPTKQTFAGLVMERDE
ncbi:MAG: NAD(P)-dependent oxidoreductase [Alphaproteobacteria bacterium]|nr:NAD(P)-dependent oxidoreductase [Alphaproteobacteria bacterium]